MKRQCLRRPKRSLTYSLICSLNMSDSNNTRADRAPPNTANSLMLGTDEPQADSAVASPKNTVTSETDTSTAQTASSNPPAHPMSTATSNEAGPSTQPAGTDPQASPSPS